MSGTSSRCTAFGASTAGGGSPVPAGALAPTSLWTATTILSKTSLREQVTLIEARVALSRRAQLAVTKLIETAAAKWRQEEGDYRDDITAIVVRMRGLFASVPA